MKPSNHPSSPAGHPAPVSGVRRVVRTLALLVLVVGVYALHQDFWNWRRIEPMLFGFLPVGLAYHIAYSFAATLMMVVLVKFAWPAHLEKYEPVNPSSPDRRGEGKS